MRIALVHDWLTIPGGSENVFKEICDMYPQGVVFTPQANQERLPWLKKMEVRTSFVQHLPFAMTKHYIYAPLMPGIFRRMDLSEFDVVLVDSHSFAHHVRPRADALFFCYYYTPARSLWTPEIDNRASSGPFTGLKKRLADKLRPLDFEAGQRPHARYAISQTTKDRLEKFYKVKVDGIIYCPVDTQKFIDTPRLSEDEGLLMWGRLIDYKRFDLAIEAARITGEKLNIVGSGPDEAKLKRQASGLNNIVFHGRLPDDELRKLMSHSRAALFPNYEDFGIIPVEAMAAGLPVVAYGVGGGAETVTAECGVHFQDATPESLAEAIRELPRRRFDIDHIRRHAREFDTSRFRVEYKAAVDKAIADHIPQKPQV